MDKAWERVLILGNDKGEVVGKERKKKEKLIKTKFISFGFVVVEEFLIKNPLLELERIKKLAAAFAFSSNLKSVHSFFDNDDLSTTSFQLNIQLRSSLG